MAPEYPPGLVIFDSRFEDDKLKGDLYYVEVPIGHRLRVRWDAERERENFRPVGGGVAYIFKTGELEAPLISHDSIPDDLGGLRYRWTEGLKLGIPWVMFVLILPSGHTLVAAEPVPARAKIFNDRLALYWILKGDDLGRTEVICALTPFAGNASSKLPELNRFCSGENPPPNNSIQIEDTSPSIPKPIFISYAHEDNDSPDRSKRWLDRLTQFLQPLVQQDELTICSDQDIGLGEDWHAHIQKHLNGARAAVLLVSPAFLASKYVRNNELPVLLRNANKQGVKIIPVIVRRCLFEETKFKYPDPKTGPEEFTLASLQASNSPTKPLSGMTEDEQDDVLLKLARALLKFASANPLAGSSGSDQRTLVSQDSSAPIGFREDISRIDKYTRVELSGREDDTSRSAHRRQTIEPAILFDWVTIPAGHFQMGSDKERDRDAEANEMKHRLYLPEYRIARGPVTVAQFREFIISEDYKTTAEHEGDAAWDYIDEKWQPTQDAYWKHPHGANSEVHEDHPVTCISWRDAVEFCKWARVRLPSEAEWEKAARWDSDPRVMRIYPWGDELADDSRCNFDMRVGDTTRVGKYPLGASAHGLCDMAGNVWEWTISLYKDYPYVLDECENPMAAGERVLRGGSFYQPAARVRCAFRNPKKPTKAVSDFGFRVCAGN